FDIGRWIIFFNKQNQSPGDGQIQRLTHIREFCRRREKNHNNKTLKFGDSFIYNDKKKFVYCRIPKVACTTWKKVVLYTLGIVNTHPVNTSLDTLYKYRMPYMKDFKNDTNRIRYIQNHYFSFMFTRHPFDRLFSAYKDKFMNPNSYGGIPHYVVHEAPILSCKFLVKIKRHILKEL
uniref:Carbohydrate sulfotransferase n=2 Tax=Clytia hemisphaerica TaxID=252671 RepID=A0A7M5UY28_9CNID